MVNRAALLADLKRLLRTLEADLLERSDEMPEVKASLEGEYRRAREAERTAQSYEEWRSDYTTQVAAAWVLSCVFVRFLEDNRLIDPPRIAGPGERLARARDEHEMYFSAHPTETDREYLLAVFDELAELPGTRDVFGPHNAVRELPNWLSGDAAGELLRFFQRIDADTGALVHDFTDPDWDTRFLGDLYQDLSEAARKKYALLQTPEFVEEFILDRTLDPAIEEFGLQPPSPASGRGVGGEGISASDNLFRMIDPACGSGHFLLGSFRRILDRWQRKEPATNVRELVQRALDSVHGVDLNPYAVAIARFRLLLAALRSCGIERLADAPAFRMNLACGDSLLHGTGSDQLVFGFDPLAHVYQSEDLPELRRILKAGHYHAVVANPPYITPKDKALNQEYRKRYSTCHRQYSLAVPFMQRIFSLSVEGGYTGQITANSFMKREFGKKLIEEFFPRVDLSVVIDTSGAYIPGHGTPTVILFARERRPVGSVIRTVMGIRGEAATPDNPASGHVWSAIVRQIDEPGSESEFVSVADSPRENFHKHPWSIGGGGAADIKEKLDQSAVSMLAQLVESIGRTVSTQGDDVFVNPLPVLRRNCIVEQGERRFVSGDEVRDWCLSVGDHLVFPYDEHGLAVTDTLENPGLRFLWGTRTVLANTFMFGGKTKVDIGMKWFEYGQWLPHRFRTPLTIVYGEIATHNHFVLDRGGKVFNRTAPVIKLPPGTSEDDHLALLGLLNSSTACFWMKQVSTCKGLGGQGGGIKPEDWHRAYAFNATKLLAFPLPPAYHRLSALANRLDRCASDLAHWTPLAVLRRSVNELARRMDEARTRTGRLFRQMTALQEELDWFVYGLFGICEYSAADGESITVGIHPEDRPAERLLRDRMEDGETSIFYEVHHWRGAAPGPPSVAMQELIESRIELISKSRDLQLLETVNHKRRWQVDPWRKQVHTGLRTWLLDRLETYFDFDGRMNDEGKPTAQLDVALVSTGRLAQVARQDGDFVQVGALYRDDPAFDVQRLVAELVEAESVPLLPVLRYKPSGLRKRAEWEKTWELQRREDAIDARTKLPQDDPEHLDEAGARDVKRREVGEIPVPPKYTSSDFLPGPCWRLRGKLDVPKERWVSFPHCEGEDGTLVIAWAGYDHLQLAKATSAYFVEVQERLGGRDDPRLVPLLACLVELVPWIKQWHNEPDPAYGGTRMGDYFEGFIQEEARQMGKTPAEIQAWEPPRRSPRRRKTSK